MTKRNTNEQMLQAGVALAEAMCPGNGELIACTTTARKLLLDAAEELNRLKGEVAVLERALERMAATVRYLEPDDTGSRGQLIAQAKEQARKELEDPQC